MNFRCEMSEMRYYGRHLDDTAAKALSWTKIPAAPRLHCYGTCT